MDHYWSDCDFSVCDGRRSHIEIWTAYGEEAADFVICSPCYEEAGCGGNNV